MIFRIILRIVIFIGCLILVRNSFKSLKKEKNTINIVEMVGTILMLISSVILLFTEYEG